MKKHAVALLAAAFFSCVAIAGADERPTCRGPLNPSESSFVASVARDLQMRFAHVTDAEKAGYIRYTNPDDTGAISYADQKWNADPTHPSQLWYDKSGDLMGADFSVPRPNGEPRPNLWGIQPCRWFEFNGHVHYVVKNPQTGKMRYDLWIWDNDFTAAGGDLAHPSPQTLVKAGRILDANVVTAIFDMPTQWDLIVWTKPHSPNALFW
jgi:hypothetical protein